MSFMKVEEYLFEYENGMRQYKYLISFEDYKEKIRPLLDQIAEEKEQPEKRQDHDKLRRLDRELRSFIGGIDVFYQLIVEGGRSHEAIIGGGILPPLFIGGKECFVKITKLLNMTGIELIALERQDQIEKHGRSVERDTIENCNGELLMGARALMDHKYQFIPDAWDGETVSHMMSKGVIERLSIAGAFIAAEIDRLNNHL